MRKRKTEGSFSLIKIGFLAVVFGILLAAKPVSASAATIPIAGTDCYATAFEVLDLINDEREAYGCGVLVMDANLMSGAMERAAELSVYYSGTRPNGSSWSTAYSGSPSSEAIDIGGFSASSVVGSWTYSEYAMLDDMTSAVGIGVFYDGNNYCWVATFGSWIVNQEAYWSSDRSNVHDINVSRNYLKPDTSYTQLYLEKGGSDEVNMRLINQGNASSYVEVAPESLKFTSSNPSVATVSNYGTVTAVAGGTANITVALLQDTSVSVTYAVTVSGGGMWNLTISTIPTQSYTGQAITPKPAIYDGSTLLRLNVDYTLSYYNNTFPGTATMTVTGIGNYSGQRDVNFTIGKPAQTITTDKPSYTLILGGTPVTVVAKATGTITFSSTNEAAFKVSPTGTITAYAIGEGYLVVNAAETVNAGANSITVPVSVTKQTTTDISSSVITVSSISKQAYTGNAVKPVLKIYNGNYLLVEKTDYELSFTDNTAPGTATVTIKGINLYTGSRKITFSIEKTAQTITTNKKSYSVTIGSENAKLNAKADGILTYKSSDTGVVKVDSKGELEFIAPGKAEITISASETNTYGAAKRVIKVTVKEITLKKAYITNIMLLKSGEVKVSWKEVKNAESYQVVYSTTKKFTAARTKSINTNNNKKLSYILSDLKKGKNYYIRVRAEAEINGEEYYGEYSKYKRIKTEKN